MLLGTKEKLPDALVCSRCGACRCAFCDEEISIEGLKGYCRACRRKTDKVSKEAYEETHRD